MRKFLLAAFAFLVVNDTTLAAEGYPARPITLVVPVAAAGPADTIARIMAERMAHSFGQPVVVENVSGANGNIGVARVARASPDGYTLVMGSWNTHVANGAVYRLAYDVQLDFAPVSLLTKSPLWIIGRNGLPASDLGELVAWLKASDHKVAVGTPGVGSLSHFAGILFQHQTGAQLQFVPYRGAGPALQDLMAGQIDLAFLDASNSLPLVRGGHNKAYAVMAASRWSAAPDVPTVDEAGVSGLYFSFWNAIWAPRQTPADVTAKINAAAMEALADSAVQQRLSAVGQQIAPRDQQTQEALGRFQKAEIDKWWPIIKAANIKLE